MNSWTNYLQTDLIMLIFFGSLAKKTNCLITVLFGNCSSLFTLLSWLRRGKLLESKFLPLSWVLNEIKSFRTIIWYILHIKIVQLQQNVLFIYATWKHVCSLGLFYIFPWTVIVPFAYINFIGHARSGDI